MKPAFDTGTGYDTRHSGAMMSANQVTIIGVYRVPVTDELVRELAIDTYGMNLSEKQRLRADANSRETLTALRLIEIEVHGNDIQIDFSKITQQMDNVEESNWQVAYDEAKICDTAAGSRWVFFFHFLNPKKPLLTQFSPISLPPEQDPPQELNGIKYYPP